MLFSVLWHHHIVLQVATKNGRKVQSQSSVQNSYPFNKQQYSAVTKKTIRWIFTAVKTLTSDILLRMCDPSAQVCTL